MKKVVILIIMVVTLSACPREDTISIDPIIGKWKLIEIRFSGFERISSIDCSDKNIIYNFKTDDILNVSGVSANDKYLRYSNGEYKYFFGKGRLGGGGSDPKILLVEIETTKWTYKLTDGKMVLSTSYLDGETLIFEKKQQ